MCLLVCVCVCVLSPSALPRLPASVRVHETKDSLSHKKRSKLLSSASRIYLHHCTRPQAEDAAGKRV